MEVYDFQILYGFKASKYCLSVTRFLEFNGLLGYSSTHLNTESQEAKNDRREDKERANDQQIHVTKSLQRKVVKSMLNTMQLCSADYKRIWFLTKKP